MKAIWDKFGTMRGVFETPRILRAQIRNMDRSAHPEVDAARRWAKAARQDPELLGDVIRLGGLLTMQPHQAGEVMPLDPNRLAYEAGRRDLALQLASMMSLSISDLNDLMRDTEDTDA